MELTINISISKEDLDKLSYDKWYSDTVHMVEELKDGSRENVEIANPQTIEEYVIKAYEDLIISDIVNTFMWYKNRVGEQKDIAIETAKRNDTQNIVTVALS